MEQKWPQQIWLVRHGQSAGNVARDQAEAAKGLLIDIAERDVDVPLSPLGVQQSQALSDWFAALPPGQQPNVVLHSPYLRAAETARIVTAGFKGDDLLAATVDERLREKESATPAPLPPHGTAQNYPGFSQHRHPGEKFFFRPPGG